MESLVGSVDHVIYHNEENNYTVLVLRMSGNKTQTCVGFLPGLSAGTTIECQGEYTSHPTYGKQFNIKSYSEKLPEDSASIEKYLSSGAIKGIGAMLATRIVQRFGNDTLRIMEENPEELAKIKGISLRKAKEIGQLVLDKSQMRRVMIFLQKYGISYQLGLKIYEKYKEKTYQVLQENPYQMAEDIRGVGFLTADEIASRIGIQTDSEYRIRSGLLYVLSQAVGEGHVFLPRQELFGKAEEILGVSASYMDKHLMDLTLEKKVYQRAVEGDTYVYPLAYYRMERNIAHMLNALNVREEVEEAKVLSHIRRIEKEVGIELDEYQKKAVLMAASHGLLIVTGGPGTGKTTTINSIIRYFHDEHCSIALAAPTGRAAKRMSEATGQEAKTIHRLLEFNGEPTDDQDERSSLNFQKNANDPLEAEVIIIDEMSMVDITLMHSLLMAITPQSRLILVGDENQLPSVGPGNVLKDMIASGVVPMVRLEKIFRQASESDIVVNAHKIVRGEPVKVTNKSKDFFLIKRLEAEQLLKTCLLLVQKKLPSYVGVSPYEIQVLTPMRKGVLGVENLNILLQRFLNPPSPEKKEREVGDKVLREGDKVMQIKNNYKLEWEIQGAKKIVIEKGVGVFNGDMGILKEINDFTEKATIEFDDGRICYYTYEQMAELDHCFAITIHKSQGSEYPAVILPLLSGPAPLMNRNLLYTAVTRAKKCVTIVGSESTFEHMIANVRVMHRYSTLDEELKKAYEEL